MHAESILKQNKQIYLIKDGFLFSLHAQTQGDARNGTPIEMVTKTHLLPRWPRPSEK